MTTDFVMPTLGADMTAGELVAWLKRPGDPIERGDEIAEVETDKGIIAVESFQSGVLEEILVQPGQKVPVGTPMARIREPDEAPESAAAAPATEPSPPQTQPTPAPPSLMPGEAPKLEPGKRRIPASPAARKRARELGLAVEDIRGTGSGGAVTLTDVENAAPAGAATAPHAVGEPSPDADQDRVARMRRSIAAAMTRSKREIPHYYLSSTIDIQPALTWLTEQNRARSLEDRLLPVVLPIKAVARALRQTPELNAAWDGDRVVLHEQVHVGVVTSLRQGGVVVPALHDADKLSLDRLMRAVRDVTERARTGRLRSSDLTDSTMTVTSLGDRGVENVFGVIYPPQVAIVGLGRIVQRPWAVDGQIVPRQVLTVTLSADHRVSDGQRGARFLNAVDRLLQEPETL